MGAVDVGKLILSNQAFIVGSQLQLCISKVSLIFMFTFKCKVPLNLPNLNVLYHCVLSVYNTHVDSVCLSAV